jgi:hypothetical protein
MNESGAIEKAAVTVGRILKIKGVGRVLRKVYPTGHKSGRYVRGVRVRGDGHKLFIDTREYLDWITYFHGEYEPHLRKVFAQLIKDGDTVVDAGANVGMHTLTFCDMVGKNEKGHCSRAESRSVRKADSEPAIEFDRKCSAAPDSNWFNK